MKIHTRTSITFLISKSDTKVISLLALSLALSLSSWAQSTQREDHSSHSASPSSQAPTPKKRLIDADKQSKQGGHKNKPQSGSPDHMKDHAKHMQQMREKEHNQKMQQMHPPQRMNMPSAEGQIRIGQYFLNHHLIAAKAYYSQAENMGYCPPGLAKKGTGCLPPGQAKPWKLGETLPRHVIYYDVPRSVVLTLGAPPSGYKYVRVGSDILLIAIGTSMVMDALQDLVR